MYVRSTAEFSIWGTECTRCGQLILRKIINIAATRRHTLRIKCTKFDFSWGSVPYLAWGAPSPPTDPLAEFKGSYFQGKGRGVKGTGGKGKGKGREG